jgi:dUTP pyrophosphatase
MITLKVKKIHPKAIVPKKATEGSACFDLFSCERAVIYNSFHRFRTGLIFEIPKGYHVEIYPRSGMASKGIILPNSPGIVDSDYRGEIVVMLYGLFQRSHEIVEVGNRIAQCRLVKNEQIEFKVSTKLSDTERGEGGFGSTGK